MSDTQLHRKDSLALHSAVVLFGMAGPIGKAVSVSPSVVVFARAALGAVALTLWLVARQRRSSGDFGNRVDAGIKGELAGLNARSLPWLAVSGLVLAVHWTAFFRSIQVSSVAVGLLSFATFPVFMALMEPLFRSTQVQAVDLVRALLVGIGMTIVIPEYDLRTSVVQGAAWGIFSALTFAVLALVNRRFVQGLSPRLIAAGQNAVAALVLAPAVVIRPPALPGEDVARLAALGIVCTAVAHALYIQGLRSVRLPVVGVISALEPVYGILLATLFLGEVPQIRCLLGGMIIIAVAMWAGASQWRARSQISA